MRYKCDHCHGKVKKGKGYILTTKQVVTSVPCWKRLLLRVPTNERSITANSSLLQSQYLALRASQTTAWLICEKCSNMFSFDRVVASAEAKKFHVSGEPTSGFPLCKAEKRDSGYVILEILDSEGLKAARSALKQAIAELPINEQSIGIKHGSYENLNATGTIEHSKHLVALPECIVIKINRQVKEESTFVETLLGKAKIAAKARKNVFVSVVPDPTNKKMREMRIMMDAQVMSDRLGMKLDPRRTEVQDFTTVDSDSGCQIIGCMMFFYRFE